MLNKPLINEANVNGNANVTCIFVGQSNFIPSDISSDCIVDSGATNHIVGTKKLLNHELTIYSPGKVELLNGDSANVTQVGCSQQKGDDVVKMYCVY